MFRHRGEEDEREILDVQSHGPSSHFISGGASEANLLQAHTAAKRLAVMEGKPAAFSLLESELEVLLEQSPASIIITNAQGAIEYVNPYFVKLTGYTAAEALGKNPSFLQSGYTSAEEYEVLWKTISGGEVWRGEFRNRKANGELYWESATIAPVKDVNGRIGHYIAVKEDCTEKKSTELELIAAKERAERSDRLKDAFIMNISHEVRTPLNIILGYLGLMSEELGPLIPDEQLGYFPIVMRAGARLQRTIENILAIASLEVGEYIFEKQIVDIVEETANIVNEMRVNALEKNLTLEFASDCECARILADPVTLSDALANIVDNAIKFTASGGVTVRVAAVAGSVYIVVTDSGIGISNEYTPAVWRAFSQEENGSTRKYDGLGLGMALTKKYVHLNGGSVHIKSEKQKGTTVLISFAIIDKVEGEGCDNSAGDPATSAV